MLQSIRDHTQGWIAGVIISILILSFALWGIHSYFAGGTVNSVAAEVNGVPITRSAVAVTYERMRRQVQTQSAHYDLSSAEEAALKKNALQALITMQVLRQASVKQNYDVSQLQIDNFLESMPEFQVNGQFSLDRFRQVLSTSMLSTDDFINLIKTTLLIDQPRLGTIFSSFALPNEVDRSIALVKQTRDIQFTVLPYGYFVNTTITISPEKVQDYYNHHKALFKTSEQVSIDYLLFAAEDIMDKIHPTDDELKAFYADNNNLFMSDNKTVSPFDNVKDKVTKIYLHQKAEEQFSDYREKLANLTYEHPETLAIAAKELGVPVRSSGPFSKATGNKDISANISVREMAFSEDVLHLKNNSDVIQIAPNQIVVLRIKTHVPAKLLPEADVEQKIIAQLKVQEIDREALKLVTEIKQALEQGTSPEKIASTYHLSWQAVGFIERHASKVDSAILETAFSMPLPTDNKPRYAITKAPDGYAILQLKAVKDGTADKKFYQVFADQSQNAEGLLEYELYKQGLLKQAKIVVHSGNVE